MKKLFSFSLFLFLVFVPSQVEAQTRTTLTQEEQDAIDTLFSQGYIGVDKGGDGWEINPDLWANMNYQTRKSFTEKLSVFYKNYTKLGPQMSGFCYFYNMATKKKIARWYKDQYKEY